ncbi:hypothetical protein LCGC14_1539020 [marine sediment metagenome]|uniref:Uncharacterized protein n=1 Tax=marine sediment metagenome TaxID=412755 RepID=A0A0F9JEK8_9ZZZZ
MIFQLIMRGVKNYQYVINFLISIIGRSLDLLSTRYVTKDLKLETNKLAKRIGWRGMVLVQIPIIVLGTLDFYISFFIFWWSMLLFANNIEGSWYIKEVGEDKYYQELKINVSKSKTWKIVISEFSNILKFTLAGIFIIIFLFVLDDLIAVFLIAVSLIIEGLIGSISSIIYLIGLKRDKSNQ